MVLKRVIPALLFDGVGLVKTTQFKKPVYVGDPVNAIKIFNDKEVDEVILLDINASKQGRGPNFDVIRDITSEAFMPFAYGGGVNSMNDFKKLFSLGVEKVIVNTLLYRNPEIVKEATKIYGAQAVVASIDIKKNIFGSYKLYSYSSQKIKMELLDFIKYVEQDLGVGELCIQFVDNEGTWSGLNQDLAKEINSFTSLPVILSGGCGNIEHIKSALYHTNVSAVAIGSMAVFSQKGMGVLINFPNRNQIISNEQ